jgi:LemA protein
MIYVLSGVVGFILFIILIIFVYFYNRFQRLKNGADAGLSQIKVVLKKRLDLIPQLTEAVKAYAKFEKNVFESITKMRSLIKETQKPKDVDYVNKDSHNILKNILATVENYPDLKTSKNVEDLMEAIIEVENEIARYRYTYNNIVQEYNTKIDSVPSNFIAKIFSYKKLEYLKFEEEINIKPDLTWSKK